MGKQSKASLGIPVLGPIVRTILGRRFGPLLLIAAGLSVGGYFTWTAVKARVVGQSRYQVTIQAISITPPPAWIKADVKAEALRDASLDLPLSILDDQLAERIAKAFSFHPWIAAVKEVRKVATAEVVVELEYRRPVCMVELPGREGLYAVDAEAFLLPTEDFLDDPKQALVYPRLSKVTSLNIGRVGLKWADPIVHGGAKVAAAVEPVWAAYGFLRIEPSELAGVPRGTPQYELATRGGSRVLWGSAPGSESGDEVSAVEKLAALKRFVDAQGSIDHDPPLRIDIRGRQIGVVAIPAVAALPTETSAAKPQTGTVQK